MRRAMVMMACASILLTGCGARTQTQPASPNITSTGVVASATGPVASVKAVKVPEQLKFTAKTLDGKDFSGQSLVGRPAVLWFWAPWCPRCQGEAEDIAAAAKETEGRVRFLGVAARDEVPAMKKFVERYQLGSFPHLADGDAVVWKRFGVTEQPAHAFIKADGTIEMVLKQLPTNELLDKVRALAGG